MAHKHKGTKRQRTAAAKKAAVLSSVEFQTWWGSRRHIRPMPSDPYRAFMIDKGIVARPVAKPIWQPRTNRTDLIPVDIIVGARHGRRLPKGRKYPRHQFREDYTPKSARPQGKLTAHEQELKKLVHDMAQHYHVSEPAIFFERGSGEGVSAMYHGGMFAGDPKPFMKIGVKNLNEAKLGKAKAVIAHEMGHHVHRRGQVGTMRALGVNVYDEAHRTEKERIAWKIADPFMTHDRPVQKWTKKYYLGTYLGTSRHENRGIKADFEADLRGRKVRKL